MSLYVDRRFLGSISVVEKDGFLLTKTGNIPVLKGQVILHLEDNEIVVMNEDYFKEYYVPIEQVKEKQKRKTFKEMSPFEKHEIEDMYKQNWVDSEDYISNKAF